MPSYVYSSSDICALTPYSQYICILDVFHKGGRGHIEYHNQRSNYDFTFNYQTSTIMRLLGFPPGTNGSSTGFSLTPIEPVNLVYTSNISIYLNIRSKSFNTAHVNKQILLCTVQIKTQPFSMITYKNYYGTYKVNTFSNILDMIEIKICDQCGD